MTQPQDQLRTVIVTGANKGIGYTIIETILAENTPYNIILTARNPSLGEKAIEDLLTKSKQTSSKVEFHQLDVNDDESVAEFVEWIKSTYGKIDALINNAGLGNTSGPGEEQVKILKTNTISVINLTEKLLPYLTDDAKIIHISSGLGILDMQKSNVRRVLNSSKLSEKDLLSLIDKLYEKTKELKQTELGFSESTYFNSKALLNAYNRWILPRKLKENQQTFSVCPGWCSTDMGGSKAPRSVEEGAVTPVYLLNLPWKKNERLNGEFLRDNKIIDYTVDSYNLREVLGIDPINI